MSFIDDLHKERQELARVLSNPEYSGIREIVEELYPDRAHFVFELLQNAEDAGATEVTFDLSGTALTFEHNGRPFNCDDVRAITNIGKGTKREQEDQIGRFGVGFKAVFGYTECPHIWSPSFSFKISELVLPIAIEEDPALGVVTRFRFPFNNPKKKESEAFLEIEAALTDLEHTTLLFLRNIQTIRWQISAHTLGTLQRIDHSANHIEISKHAESKTLSAHFLRFSQPVEGLDKQNLSLAFELDFLPNKTGHKGDVALADQFMIVPAKPGRVAVFFPAEKETSGLRFHLHAPFVTELSRASIKETAANDPLFSQVATLSSESLHSIRDLDLLSVGFLGVLPNPQDDIPTRYHSIRTAIINEMNEQALTPTYSKTYAPAKHLLQSKASLKELLSTDDLEIIVDHKDEPPQWAVGAPQKNSNIDRFLSCLSIRLWDGQQLIEMLKNKTSDYSYGPPHNISGQEVMTWLASKPLEWHQEMYALLREEVRLYPEYRRRTELDRLRRLKIVRLSDGTYDGGPNCYFPTDDVEHDEILPRVAAGVYSSGKKKTQREEAKKFLEEIGVREVGEKEEIKAILDQRYQADNFKPEMKDLSRFISLVEKEPKQASLFHQYYIFKRVDGKWGMPSQTFIDSPFHDTSLATYYNALGEGTDRSALSDSYQQSKLSAKRILKFAEAVGVHTKLEIEKASCWNNPNSQYLAGSAPGGWSSSYGVNEDYNIDRLEQLLDTQNQSLSRLVWKTICENKDTPWTIARFRNNSNYQARTSPSQLACILRDSAWIPQTSGMFVRPAQASRELLPKGFPFDEGYEWLDAIRFGQDDRQRVEERVKNEATAKELGFATSEILERAKRFAAIPEAEQERILIEFGRKQGCKLPEHVSTNPERRATRVAQQAATAPKRITEERTRSVSIGVDVVKTEAAEYLKGQYTNQDGEMICQVCKDTLPFKLSDGNYYFEKVEFLAELKKRHHQNYLTLCPNHSAMFQHANGSSDKLRSQLLDLESNEFDIVLAENETTMYFTKTHIADLKTVIHIEEQPDPEQTVAIQ